MNRWSCSVVMAGGLLTLASGRSPGANLEWKSISPDGFGFRALFPGEPTFSTNPPDAAADDKNATRRWGWTIDPNYLMYLTVMDLKGPPTPADQQAKLLEKIRDGHAQNLMGEVLQDAEVERGGQKGRDFTIKGKSGLQFRMLIVLKSDQADRLYQALVIGNADDVKSDDAEKFLKSFELIKNENEEKKEGAGTGA